MIITPDTHLVSPETGYTWNPKKASEGWQRSYRELGQRLTKLMDGRLLMTVGIVASGKTSILDGTHGNEELSALIREKYDVVFDAWFYRRVSRSAVLNIAIGAGWTVDCLFVGTPMEICVERNLARFEHKPVPMSVLSEQADKLQPPELSEGFSRITRIGNDADMGGYLYQAM